MSIDLSNEESFNYLVTIKCNHTRFISIEDIDVTYNEVLSKLKHYELSDVSAYELDSNMKFHKHFIVTVYKKPPYFKLFTKLGWQIHFQEFPTEDSDNVREYLRKVNQSTIELHNLEQKSRQHYSTRRKNIDRRAGGRKTQA